MEPLDSLISRLPDGAVSTHPGELATRTRDWWALAMLRERRGDRLTPPQAVVFPTSTDDVAAALTWSTENKVPVVPRGGGSGVCGGAEAIRGGIVLDLSRMSRVLSLDKESLAVEVEAGIRGQKLEEELAPEGLTLGHYPQSLSISSVGGWIAARSAGQASAGYGAIEDLLLGLTAVMANGEVARLRAFPRTAAGPDLRQLFVGAEGTLGVVTEATLSVSPLPDGRRWLAFAPSSFQAGMELVRSLVQQNLPTLVIRLYDEDDAKFAFEPVGHKEGPALVVGLAEGSAGVDVVADAFREEASLQSAKPLSDDYGTHWWDHRFDAVELYRSIMENKLMGDGSIADTMEVAGLWSKLPGLYTAVRDAILKHADSVGCHLSHPYRSGASLYFTFLLSGTNDGAVERMYLACWEEAARACHAAGGTITHHHGVGLLKTPFMEGELGPGGLGLLRSIKGALDPEGVLNPGKLIPGG